MQASNTSTDPVEQDKYKVLLHLFDLVRRDSISPSPYWFLYETYTYETEVMTKYTSVTGSIKMVSSGEKDDLGCYSNHVITFTAYEDS